MSVAGGVGENGASSPNRKGAGGGGAAGFIKIWCVSMQFSGTLNASGGVGGAAGDGLLGAGGNGSDGRIAIYSCSNTQAYASNPGPYMSTGGFAFCSNNNQII